MAIVKKLPKRLCIGCMEMKDKKELLRIVKSEEDISLDITGRKNGRGAYICNNKECFEKAFKKHGLERSFKMNISKAVYDSLLKEMQEFNG